MTAKENKKFYCIKYIESLLESVKNDTFKVNDVEVDYDELTTSKIAYIRISGTYLEPRKHRPPSKVKANYRIANEDKKG